MISDETLYNLANNLGILAVVAIMAYHWIETNSKGRAQPVIGAGKTAVTLK